MKDFSELEKDLSKELKMLEHFYSVQLPEEQALELEILKEQSFKKEQYQGQNKKKWEPRKDEKADYTKKGNYKRRSRRRGILKDSGDLEQSEQATIDRSGKEISVSIGSDLIYAPIHNEGLMGKAWGKHPFKMPQRQSMPLPGEEEPVITAKMEIFIDKNLDKIFK